jgi:GNAT superfamily N-acetyltransferase
VDQATLNVGEHIYDFEKDEWDKNVRGHYKSDLFYSDMLILARIEILPAYRGQGVGPKAIKDLYNNFIQGCALFALKCFPLQAEYHLEEPTDPFHVGMCYDHL